jgi:hypothetical protein
VLALLEGAAGGGGGSSNREAIEVLNTSLLLSMDEE